MNIVRIETRFFEDTHLPQLLVLVTTEDGLAGVGEAWWGLSCKPVKSAVEDLLAPQAVGEDSRDIERIWHKLYRYAYRYATEGVVLCALSGIDLALWDLLGKRLGAPVSLLLGGRFAKGIRCYASLPPLRDPRRLKVEIERAMEAGFRGVKLHEREVAMAAMAREVLPADHALMFDVNGHWNPLEAEEAARALEPYGVTWLEEPIWPMQDHRAMARIRKRVGMRFAAGENEFTLKGLHDLMASGAVDYIMPEITKIGGLTTARKVSAIAELFNTTICPHGFRIGPALYANIHWALSHPNMDWLEVPWLPEGMRFPSGIQLPPMADGGIQSPGGPGLGLNPEVFSHG